MNTPEQYQRLWDMMVIDPKRMEEAGSIAFKANKNKSRYDAVVSGMALPWQVLAAIHSMEASQNFTRHLHNGDKLTARTTHVPAGRPLVGNPPFTWEESALDAIKLRSLDKISDWSISNTLLELEKYNGGGYAKRGLPSPYLWAATNNYTKGKYVADGQFDPNAVSTQIGAAAILKQLAHVS